MSEELVINRVGILTLGPDPPHHVHRVDQITNQRLELLSRQAKVRGGVDIVGAEQTPVNINLV